METLEIRKNNQKFINDVISKANQDSTFKQELLADPEKALKAFSPKFGMPKGWDVVVEDQKDTVFIDFVRSEDVELSEEDLEQVAGGSWDWCIGSYQTN